MKNALVIGASGLVGKELVKELLACDGFERVVVFLRTASGIRHPRLTEHVIDFHAPASWQHLVKGDVLFSALGTTLKKAGSKKAQHAVDYGLQFAFADIAARRRVPAFVLVSSAGASPDARAFYFRMKGELERDVACLPFDRLAILRPGPLYGEREEQRIGEGIGIFLVRMLNKLGLLRHFRPISGKAVARAMIQVFFLQNEARVSYGPRQLHDLSAGYMTRKNSAL